MEQIISQNANVQAQESITKYRVLLDRLDEMITTKGRGYRVTEEINDAFWEQIDIHRDRLSEQINHLKTDPINQNLKEELKQADSIYEAARKYISKY